MYFNHSSFMFRLKEMKKVEVPIYNFVTHRSVNVSIKTWHLSISQDILPKKDKLWLKLRGIIKQNNWNLNIFLFFLDNLPVVLILHLSIHDTSLSIQIPIHPLTDFLSIYSDGNKRQCLCTEPTWLFSRVSWPSTTRKSGMCL